MWAIEHPGMAFSLALAVLFTVNSIVKAICNAVVRARYMKVCEALGAMPKRVWEEKVQ